MTHIVMTGSDTSMYTAPHASETAARMGFYARTLNELHPGSHLTYMAIGAPQGSQPICEANLSIIPVAGLGQLYAAFAKLQDINLITPQTCTEEAWIAYLFAVPRKIPVVPQEHGDPFSPHRRSGAWWRKNLLRLRDRLGLSLLRLACGVRAVSPEVAEKIKPLMKSKPVAVFPVPVSITPLERQETTPTLLFVGRLDPGKNVATFLQIAAKVRRSHPDLRIEIAGDGPDRAVLENMADSLGLRDCCTFHGWVSQNKLAECYARATLFVFPTLHEAFGRVVIEALLCGVPVISSLAVGPRFILQPDDAGILLDAMDIEGFSTAILNLLTNPGRRDEYRQRGYKTAVRFSRNAMSRQWMGWLAGLAKGKDTCASC